MATITKEQKINTIPNWEKAVNSLNAFITELGEKSVSEGFFNGDKVKNQPIAILCHTSAGAIGDKFDNCKTTDERLEKIVEILKGKLTPEEIEANNKRDAMQAYAEGMPKKFAKLVPAFKKYVDEIWGTED